MRTTIIGFDLVIKAIQVCVYLNSKVLSNKEMTSQQLSEFLRQQFPCIVVFESCSDSNYRAQYRRSVGHKAKLISTRLVCAIRHNQKTDKNDALAIVKAALLPIVYFDASKTSRQQQAQVKNRAQKYRTIE